MKEIFSFQDSILDGITIDDVITAVLSNEKEVNEQTVTKVYNEILRENRENAREMLKKYMQAIIKEVLSNRE
ncbi:MAG: hypothetical protein WC108_08315 [Bacteroidales bacterium]